MKKMFLILMIVLFPCNVLAEEIQLTDYKFTNAKRMLDGYSCVSLSNSYRYENILKPNGERLLYSTDYNIPYTVDKDGNNIYPQSPSGNVFIIGRNSGTEFGFVDKKGNIISDFGAVSYCINVPQYFVVLKKENNNGTIEVINTVEKKHFYCKKSIGNPYFMYYNNETDNFAFVEMKYKTDTGLNTADVTVQIYHNGCKTDESTEQVMIENSDVIGLHCYNDVMKIDNKEMNYKGIKYFSVITAASFLETNPITDEKVSDRVNKSYIFKEKQINGQTYYALFKELKKGESVKDFATSEHPASQFVNNINIMADKQLLFNDELCFFNEGITALDFNIVLGRMYCQAENYNIDHFVSGTQINELNNPYCLLLADKNILSGNNDLYINKKIISQNVVANALDKIAVENRILTEWSKVKEIQNTEEECSRELAYSEIYKLYELLQNPDTPKDIGAMAGIYIIIGSLLILSVGALANDFFKFEFSRFLSPNVCKNAK